MVKGIYFHIPFCSYKCPYCDFVSVVEPVVEASEYMNLLLKELDLYKDLPIKPQTLYFGGGTPSLIRPSKYAIFLDRLGGMLDTSQIEEITLECNPEDYRLEDFKSLRDLGFNRISMGVQSLRDEGLKALGRRHSLYDALKAIDHAQRAGFENINIDLIYGYHGQRLGDLRRELELLKSLPVSHVSFYLLTPYEDTPFGLLHQKGLLELPDQDTLADMYYLVCESLEAMGFVQYEISNFSREGFQCKHNMLYWTHEEFLGLGVSAWSFVDKVRFGNTKNLRHYAKRVGEGKSPVDYEERLSGYELLYDYLFVALRTTRGVERGLLPSLPEELQEYFQPEGERLRLNRKGMILINELLWKLREAILLKT